MKKILLFLLFASFATALFPQTLLTDLVKEAGAEFYYDYWRGVGHIVKNQTNLTFLLEQPFILENYQKKVAIDYIKLGTDGAILVGEEAKKEISDILAKSIFEAPQKVAAIIIDAGHGGKDSGAVSPFLVSGKRVQEKDVVLDIALTVYNRLVQSYPDKKILLTRGNDTFLTLEERTNLANGVKIEKNEAILFVSIHANASLRESASGFEVWYLPPDVKRNMLNSSIIQNLEEEGVAHILNSLLDEETTVESVKLADSILKSMAKKIGSRSDNRGLKEESWFVVRNAKMPSVLIEVGFVSNKKEAALLNDNGYRSDIGFGIFEGISEFVSSFELSNGFTKLDYKGAGGER